MYLKHKREKGLWYCFLCENQAILILVKLFFFLPATVAVLGKSGNIYLIFNKHPCFSAFLDLTLLYNPVPGPFLLIYPGLSKNNKVWILVKDTKCELLPVVCRDKPERSGGYLSRRSLAVQETTLGKPGLTWTLPGTCWPDRATGKGLGKAWEWFGKDLGQRQCLTKPLKVNVRAVLSFPGLFLLFLLICQYSRGKLIAPAAWVCLCPAGE